MYVPLPQRTRSVKSGSATDSRRDRVNGHLARLALHRPPLARQLVEALAVVVERRVHRRHLPDHADEGAERRLDGRGVERGHRGRLEHRPAQVLGLGHDAEPDGRHVLLVELDQVGRELGRLADQDRQHARGVGIERAAVTDLGGAQHAAEVRHHLERRHARPLVHRQDAGRPAAHAEALASSAAPTAASTAAVASSSVPRSVQPAAFS